ncbi:hypothetical protein ACHAWF_016067 [Thalassiosira exigua]
MQFGRALQQFFQRIYNAHPRHGPVHTMKVDISNGFDRVWLSSADVPTLGMALPTTAGEEQLMAFPLVLPMGWVESPPHFCAVTENVADMANNTLHYGGHVGDIHRLDEVADSPPAYPALTVSGPVYVGRRRWRREMLPYIDIYVDDFLGLAQGSQHQR